MNFFSRIPKLLTTLFRPNNVSVKGKGLILVALPVLSELIFVLVLSFFLRNAELQVQLQSHYREIAAETCLLGQNSYKSLMLLAFYGATRLPEVGSEVELSTRKTEDQLDYLRSLVIGSANETAELNRLDEITQLLVSNISSAKKLIESGSQLDSLAVIGRTNRELARFLSASTEFIQLQRKNELHPADNDRSRDAVHIAIIAGLLVNVLVAVGLSRFFSSDIASRLRLVVENSRLLAEEKPLRPQMEGTDEISELDRNFHQMADELAERARREREILAIVSHDMRTPLTSMQALLSMTILVGEKTIDKEHLDRIQKAKAIAGQITQLVNDLLDVEKIRAGKLDLVIVETELDAVCSQAKDLVAPAASNNGVDIEFIGSNDVIAMADPDRIMQVLVNLISNAAKVSPAGSKVTIEASLDATSATVTVRDSGPGIDEGMLDAIFDRYTQIAENKQIAKGGTGLGLPICKMIVEQHGGSIGVESQLGCGSTFWFKLPRAPIVD